MSPPQIPPKLGGNSMSPPLARSWGGYLPANTQTSNKISVWRGNFAPCPPQTWGDNTFFTSFPPNWQDDARFWLRASLGGKCLNFVGGKEVNFPPNRGGPSPPISPPRSQKTIDLQEEMHLCPPQLVNNLRGAQKLLQH